MYRLACLFAVAWFGLAWLIACGPADSPTHTPDTVSVQPTEAPTLSESPTLPAAPTASPASTRRVANADVLHVRAVEQTSGGWTFHVTVQHPDTGWEDYADGWDVVAPDGSVLKPDPSSPFTRLLLHPHEDEQPFTRSQSGIVIPEGVTQVRVRAHDLVDGWGGREVLVDLAASSGSDFEVELSPQLDRSRSVLVSSATFRSRGCNPTFAEARLLTRSEWLRRPCGSGWPRCSRAVT